MSKLLAGSKEIPTFHFFGLPHFYAVYEDTGTRKLCNERLRVICGWSVLLVLKEARAAAAVIHSLIFLYFVLHSAHVFGGLKQINKLV